MKTNGTYIMLLALTMCFSACNRRSEPVNEVGFADTVQLEHENLDTCEMFIPDTLNCRLEYEEKLVQAVLEIKMKHENLDTCDMLITNTLNQYLKNVQKELPAQPIEQYDFLVDLIDNHLIWPGETQSDMNISGWLRGVWQEYLSYHYFLLAREAAKDFYPLLKRSQDAFQEFVDAENEYLLCSEDDSGSASPLVYSDLFEKLNRASLQNVLEFYFAWNMDNYTVENKYLPIPENHYADEYKAIEKYLNSERWCAWQNGMRGKKKRKDAINALHKMESAWHNLMHVRAEVVVQLPNKVSDLYQQSTYRLQRFHLLQLKNMFREYGVTTTDVSKCLLPDSCSYEELLNASSFTERWKAYLETL